MSLSRLTQRPTQTNTHMYVQTRRQKYLQTTESAHFKAKRTNQRRKPTRKTHCSSRHPDCYCCCCCCCCSNASCTLLFLSGGSTQSCLSWQVRAYSLTFSCQRRRSLFVSILKSCHCRCPIAAAARGNRYTVYSSTSLLPVLPLLYSRGAWSCYPILPDNLDNGDILNTIAWRL